MNPDEGNQQLTSPSNVLSKMTSLSSPRQEEVFTSSRNTYTDTYTHKHMHTLNRMQCYIKGCLTVTKGIFSDISLLFDCSCWYMYLAWSKAGLNSSCISSGVRAATCDICVDVCINVMEYCLINLDT